MPCLDDLSRSYLSTCPLVIRDAQFQLRPAKLLMVASGTLNYRQAVTTAKLLNRHITRVEGGEKVGAAGRNNFSALGVAAGVRP